jgi:hypothetical protein
VKARALFVVSLAAALAGCASVDPYASPPIASHLMRDDAVGYCARLFEDIDRRVDVLGVRDAEAPRVEGFPYLRIDRFDAALATRADNGAARAAWLARLAALDETARTAELANAALPSDDVMRCRALLAAEDVRRFVTLRERAHVADDYSTAMRAVGLYPLTRLAFAQGIAAWHKETIADFALPIEGLPVRGTLVRYAAADVPARVALPMPVDALGLPQLSRFDQNALLLTHAPVFEIDVAGAYDKPGTVVLGADQQPDVDPAAPLLYTRTSYALIDGRAHLQLVYTVFFSERPAIGQFDPLAGHIDGLVWRVTLAPNGMPLVFDTIHPCGCYHMFFPTEHVQARPRDDGLDEGLFAPQRVHAPLASERVVLRIQSGTHYVQRVWIEPRGKPAVALPIDDERRLTSLPLAGGGTRSAYGPDGLMPGSERSERLFFWPMGIASAGQMRQWGRHATAFVGRRHFDDPLLLDSYFIAGAATSTAISP